MVPLAVSRHPYLLALVADPDPDTRDLHALVLGAVCERIEKAHNGEDALRKAEQDPPELIVSETSLPGIDGFGVARALRKSPATRATQIVFVTAAARPEDRDRAFAAGADAVLVKPCAPDELLAEVRRLRHRADRLRATAAATRAETTNTIKRSRRLVEESRARRERAAAEPHLRMARADYTETTAPPIAPPALACPVCDRPLTYRVSRVGLVIGPTGSGQVDCFDCASCGSFVYRHSTGQLSAVQ